MVYFDEDDEEEKCFVMDYIWYLWCGLDVFLFDKDKMVMFECYFIVDKSLYKEMKGYYYVLCNKEEICDWIFEEFGVIGQYIYIINGYVLVKIIKGEQLMKVGGKLLVIDGGFLKVYQLEIGIVGYMLVYYLYGLQLVQYDFFQFIQKVIEEGQDIKLIIFVIEFNL